MKILLLGHGRCGSTSLHYGLSDIMNHKMVIEPFNRGLWKSYYKTNPPFKKGDSIGQNVIFKTLVGPNFQNEWIDENYRQFDKTIILMRGNFRETVISHQNAFKYGYINQYEPTEKITKPSLSHVIENYKWLPNFYSRTVTTHLIWYEDIYTEDSIGSKDVIRLLDLGLSEQQLDKLYDKYLNPKFRLRKKLTQI